MTGKRFADRFVVHSMLIVITGVLLYANTLGSPFIFDDYEFIVNNPIMHDLSFLWGSTTEIGLSSIQEFIRLSRVVTLLSFWLNYQIGGDNVVGYHMVNIAIHVACGLLVYALARQTLGTPVMRGRAERWMTSFPLLSALLFIVHPIQTSAVTYISQRSGEMATMFYLMAMCFYAAFRLSGHKGARRWHYAACVLSAALGMVTKEITITLPLMVALYEFVFFEGDGKSRVRFILPLVLVMIIVPLGHFRTSVAGGIGNPFATPLELMSRSEYFIAQIRVFVSYMRLLALPMNQTLDYMYPVYISFLDPEVFISFIFAAGLLIGGIALVLSRSAERKLIGFGVVWIFISMMVESSVIPLSSVIFEYRLYLPMAGIVFASSGMLLLVFDRLNLRQLMLVIPLLCLLSAATLARNVIWRNDIDLWQDSARKSPNNWRANANLGAAYYYRGMMAEAIPYLENGIALIDHSPWAYEALGMAYYRLGMAQLKLGRNELAVASLDSAIQYMPNRAGMYLNLGIAYMNIGANDYAEKNFMRTLEIRPDDERALSMLEQIRLKDKTGKRR